MYPSVFFSFSFNKFQWAVFSGWIEYLFLPDGCMPATWENVSLVVPIPMACLWRSLGGIYDLGGEHGLRGADKLDGVGPVDNRPSPEKLHHFEKKREKNYTWHVTPDTWHLTRDTWHVTYDTWHVTHGGGWTFSPNFSSPALMVWDWQYLEYISTNHDWVN